MESETRIGHIQTTVASLVLISGLIHIAVMQVHFLEARGAGLFFLTIGSAQIIWSLLYLKDPDHRFERLGIMAVTVAPTLLFILTRTFRAPFAAGPEDVDTLGLITVVFQVAAFAGLYWVSSKQHTRPVGRAVAIGLVAGLVLYAGGVAAEGVHILSEPDAPHVHDDAHGGMDAHGNTTMEPHGNMTADDHPHDESEPHGH